LGFACLTHHDPTRLLEEMRLSVSVSALLPDSSCLQIEQVTIQDDGVVISVQARSSTSCCPLCGRASDRVHSQYTRRLADLPWHGRSVRLQLHVRRFFCSVPDCTRRIFAERLSAVAGVHARTTNRLREAHCLIAMALRGEPGARLAKSLAMATSPDTLLRRIQGLSVSVPSSIRVLGVDDWAWRRRQRYGTILCDLERRCPVDLLRERTAQALRDWLQQHPEIQVISRDRGDDYIKGATEGAPQAVQVADRWHLLRNLRDALVRTLDRHQAVVREASRTCAVKPAPQKPTQLVAEPPTTRRLTAQSESRRARRLQRFEEVKQLHAHGVSQRVIAERLGIHRGTVRRFVHASSFPERAQRRYRRRADSSTAYLRRRWGEGCRNAARLTKELEVEGFNRSYHSVRRQVARWRRQDGGAVVAPGALGRRRSSITRPSSRRISWLLLKTDDSLEPDEREFVQVLQERSPELRTAAELAREFREIIRQRKKEAWSDWLVRARAPETAKELRTFADGLQKDEAAVQAALTLEWSNGQVEGQVNKLKTLKRQMYGRANFDLLRRRFLRAR
jgi:transposase